MIKLPISPDLVLPLDAATQTFSFIARKGAGKTYAAGKLAELLLDAGVQVVVLDSVGNWYGLRLAANGKDPGYDIPVIGGLRGDIPLQSTGGELIADIAVDTGRSLILDVSQFSLADRKRFATSFGQRLWIRKKGESHPSPLMLVIEESQLIVPQRVDAGSAPMVGIYEEIIRLGRNYGIGVTMISQRPQSVNKDVLNQTECLFVGQVNGSQERKALAEWITYQGMDKSLVDELPSLAVGTMYVWSPQWLKLLEKVRIGTKTTYDASATPRVGEKRVARELKPLNLDDLREKMAATIQHAKQNDPKELHREIAALKRQLANRSASQPVDDAAIKRAVDQALSQAGREHNLHLGQYQAVIEKLQSGMAAIGKIAGQYVSVELHKIVHREVTVELPPRPAAGYRLDHPRRRTKVGDEDELKGPHYRILNAIAWLNSIGVDEPEQTAVAFLAGYRIGGGAYNNPRGRLSQLGLVEYLPGDRIRLTAEGGKLAETPDAPLDAGELQRRVLQRLPGPERKILSVLLENRAGMTNEELAEASGYAVNGGAYNNPRGRLRMLGLVEYQRGVVVPKPLLFLEA